ncbi:MAG: hypothetical protein ACI3Y0_04895 [Prevotella sp.]
MRKIYALITLMLLAVCPKAMAEEEGATLLWSVIGDVKHDYDSETVDLTATMEAYSDGSYIIKNYYAEGGSDLKFTVADGKMTITNGSSGYLYNVSGPEAIDIIYYYDGDYSQFEGDKDSGELWFCYYYYADGVNCGTYIYYTFTWPSTTTAISSVKAESVSSDRIISVSGIEYSNKANLPAGLYIKNGKKVLVK